MIHPYAPRTRDRDRRLAQPAVEPFNPVAWIVAIGFIFTLGCVVYPLFQHVLAVGQ